MTRNLVLFLTTATLSFCASAQFNRNSYEPARFDSLLITYAHLLEKEPRPSGEVDIRVTKLNRKYRVTVVYLDSVRQMDVPTTETVHAWLTQTVQRPELKDLMIHEILVLEDSRSHWVPIQEPLLADLREEVAEQGRVDLYVSLVGSVYDDLVYLINDFAALE